MTVSLVALRVKHLWQPGPMVVQPALETFCRWRRHYRLRETVLCCYDTLAEKKKKKQLLVFSLHLDLTSFKLLPLVSLPSASSH